MGTSVYYWPRSNNFLLRNCSITSARVSFIPKAISVYYQSLSSQLFNCLSHIRHAHSLQSPLIDKSIVLRRTTNPPSLPPKNHRHGCHHTRKNRQPKESKHPSIPRRINKRLYRIRKREIDQRTTHRQYYDHFTRNAGERFHGICCGDGACGNLVCDHTADAEGDGHPVGAGLGAPAVEEVA